jgi:hypothetical protein
MRAYKTDDRSKETPLPVRAYRSTWFSLRTGKLYRQTTHPIGNNWVLEVTGVPTLAEVLESGNIMENLQQIESENGSAWMYVHDLVAAFGFDDKNISITATGLSINNGLDQPITIDWLTNRITLNTIETFIDDTAAGVGGLTLNQVYQTPTGELRIKL